MPHRHSAFSMALPFPKRSSTRAMNSKCRPWRCSTAMAFMAPHVFIWQERKPECGPMSARRSPCRSGCALPVLALNRTGYQNLCRLLTESKLRAPKERQQFRRGSASLFRWPGLPDRRRTRSAASGDSHRTASKEDCAPPNDSSRSSGAIASTSNCSGISCGKKKQ